MLSPNPRATVVITTRNRKDELRNALRSCLEQTADIEVLVVDDGSTDGTSQMVLDEFPGVRIEASAVSQGLIVQRTRAGSLAAAPVIVSIDDDAVFGTPDIIDQTLADFDHPRVGAVTIPYKDVLGQTIVRTPPPPDRDGVWACEHFVGTSHALRRDLFLQLGGYRAMLYNRGEERDYCIRLLNLGYITRLGRGDFILHNESSTRSSPVQTRYLARNFVLFPWHNTPLINLPVHLAGATLNQLRRPLEGRGLRRHAVFGIAQGMVDMLRHFGERRPVRRSVYRLFRRLQYSGPIEFTQIESLLPRLPDIALMTN